MDGRERVSRRRFVGGLATTVGFLSLRPDELLAQGASPRAREAAQAQDPIAEYDGLAKIANNENPWGPPESVLTAMKNSMKYGNRYGYPDGGIVQAIADHHGVKPQNVMITAGSGEMLTVVGLTFLQGGKKVVGVDPTYNSVYAHATNIKADVIRIPLNEDFSQNIPAMIRATKRNYRDVGFVYLVNPNNPTGVVVPNRDVKALLDGIPEDIPVLLDEAYHHFVEDPSYATGTPYVIEGRKVILCRTFSKISGLAGWRLGYAIAPTEIIQQMRPYSTGTINAMVKWGGVAALKDTAAMERVKRQTIEIRKKAVADLQTLGYQSIRSDTNFFMVHIRRPVQPVIEEFRKKGVLVGRPFPPMTEHLRVSVGTEDEMRRFATAFREIFTVRTTSGG